MFKSVDRYGMPHKKLKNARVGRHLGDTQVWMRWWGWVGGLSIWEVGMDEVVEVEDGGGGGGRGWARRCW